MKHISLLACVLLVGCASLPSTVTRTYDAGTFFVEYAARSRVDPVFTGIYTSPAERADGMIYYDSSPPGGFFGNIPGRSFAIALMPASRFSAEIEDEDHLATRLPMIRKEFDPSKSYQAVVISGSRRKWVRCEEQKVERPMPTHITYYSYASPEYIICVGWDYPRGLPAASIEREQISHRIALDSIHIKEK